MSKRLLALILAATLGGAASVASADSFPFSGVFEDFFGDDDDDYGYSNNDINFEADFDTYDHTYPDWMAGPAYGYGQPAQSYGYMEQPGGYQGYQFRR